MIYGSNVLIASNVQIYTATHSTKVSERMVQNWSEGEEICRTYALPVKIEDGVWIGGGAILLPGVIIGRNSVIGAGQRCHPFHPCQLCGGGQSLPCNQTD